MPAGDRRAQDGWLSRVLAFTASAPHAAAPSRSSPTGAVAYAKSRLAWLAARKTVEGELDRLRQEIVATFEADGSSARQAAGFAGWVSPVLDTFDTGLADTLDAAVNETDPARRGDLVARARQQLQGYQAFLASPMIADLEQNPFTPVSIRKPVGDTLAALARTLR